MPDAPDRFTTQQAMQMTETLRHSIHMHRLRRIRSFGEASSRH